MIVGGVITTTMADAVIEERTGDRPTVPPPVPPDDSEAWYAPQVRAQREVHPGVVEPIETRQRPL